MRSVKLLLVLIVVALVAAVVYVYASPSSTLDGPKAPAIPVAQSGSAQPLPSGLVMPVQGVKSDQLTDTWHQSREGGARVHEAIDIMAPGGTPVLAALPGTVEKLFQSDRGGTTIYIRTDDSKWTAYYAHLRGYAPGLAEGQRITAGQLIGYVGDTGDAGPGNFHLHFALNRMAPGERWWQGTAINPYPILAGKPSGS
ncbi:hypothetical protein SPAN111604_01095 [Sphingomonas antarctica]|uniref:M23 family metallopeptidase n=1 Tax=Sphingomonas antarctica TaxID=2040274 RepID=UPI0039EABAF4